MIALQALGFNDLESKIENGEVANAINAELTEVERHGRQALDHALRVGEMLQHVQHALSQGQFEDWLEANHLKGVAANVDFEMVREWMARDG